MTAVRLFFSSYLLITCKLKELLDYEVIRCTLQAQFERRHWRTSMFQVVKINREGMRGPRGMRLTVFGQNIFFTAGCFVCLFHSAVP